MASHLVLKDGNSRFAPALVQPVLRVIRFSSQYGGDLLPPAVVGEDAPTTSAASYSLKNLEGGPSVYPLYGDATTAAVFRTFGRFWKKSLMWLDDVFIAECCSSNNADDFVDLFYRHAVYPTQIQIFETFNVGHLSRISGGWAESSSQPVNYWSVLWRSDNNKRTVSTYQHGGHHHDDHFQEDDEHHTSTSSLSPSLLVKEARIFSPAIRRVRRLINVLRIEICSDKADYYPELDAVALHGNNNDNSNIVSNDNDTSSELLLSRIKKQSKDSNNNNSDKAESTDVEIADEGDNENENNIRDVAVHSCPNQLTLESLPAEIIITIVNCVSDQFKLHLVFSLSAVSSYLRAVMRDANLFSKLDLKPLAPTNLSAQFFDFICERSHALRHLRLSWLPSLPLSELSHFVRPHVLTTLSAQACPFVNDDFLESLCSSQVNLQTLDLSGCRNVTPRGFGCLVHLKSLRRLSLYRTLIDQYTLRMAVCSFRKLESINLGSLTLISNADAICSTLAEFCPSLRAVDFWRAGASLTSRGVNELATGCHLLEEVDFGWCNKVSSESIVLLTTMCHGLRRIMLTANRSISDSDLEVISDNAALLEQLDILGSRVSYPTVYGLLLKCRKLFYLDVSYCGLEHSEFNELRTCFPSVHIPTPSN